MAAPEALLTQLLAGLDRIEDRILSVGPLVVPFGHLATIDGWLVDPFDRQNAGTPFGYPSLEPNQRALRGLLVACDYAIRRGATDLNSLHPILKRESPIPFVSSEGHDASIAKVIGELGLTGADSRPRITRRRGHALSAPLVSDPVLSFKIGAVDHRWGDNALSSFVVHNEGEADRSSIVGDPSPRWAVEVGLPDTVPTADLVAIEPQIAAMPGFLSNVQSRMDDDALILEWSGTATPSPGEIAQAIRAWAMAFFDLPYVDVRLVFAPSRGRSAVLTEMRARARAFRLYRDAVAAGHADPASVVAEFQRQQEW